MRVLLVGNHWTQVAGGAETMLVLTADLLRAAGHEVVPFAVAEEGTLPTPVRDRLPVAAGAGARTRFGEAWAGTWSPRARRALSCSIGTTTGRCAWPAAMRTLWSVGRCLPGTGSGRRAR